jgi:hypothetical protein
MSWSSKSTAITASTAIRTGQDHQCEATSIAPLPIAARESHGQDRTLALPQPISTWLSPLATVRRWYWRSSLRILLVELGTLRHRMKLALEIHEWERRCCRGSLPSLLAALSSLQSRSSQPAYTHYTQQVQARHPFLSVVDLSLLGQAYLEGWECGSRSGGSSQTSRMSCSSVDSVDGNSMPLPCSMTSNTELRHYLHAWKISLRSVSAETGLPTKDTLRLGSVPGTVHKGNPIH